MFAHGSTVKKCVTRCTRCAPVGQILANPDMIRINGDYNTVHLTKSVEEEYKKAYLSHRRYARPEPSAAPHRTQLYCLCSLPRRGWLRIRSVRMVSYAYHRRNP